MMDLLKNAIRNRLRLAVNYDPGERVIEPHALGFSSAGDPLLRAYQVSGASASGEHPYWRLFRVDSFGSCEPNGEKFANPRPGYRRGDKAMKGGLIEEL